MGQNLGVRSITNRILYNSKGRVRLTWKLAGIIVLESIIFYTIYYLLYFLLTAQGYPPWELLLFLERSELWIYQFASIGVLTLFIFTFDRFTLVDVGLAGRPGAARHLLFGMVLGAALISVNFLIMLAAGWVTVTGSIGLAGAAAPLFEALLGGALFFALVSLSEELLFRAYFFRNYTGPTVHAVVVSSIFFAVMHIFNPNASVIGLINIFIAGVLFACGYLWSGSLYLPIGIHFTWNYVMGHIYGLPVSGLQVDGLLRVEVSGPAWVTGGEFGLEGGFLATAFLLAGFGLTRIYTRLWR